jgi:hypothetical protein
MNEDVQNEDGYAYADDQEYYVAWNHCEVALNALIVQAE